MSWEIGKERTRKAKTTAKQVAAQVPKFLPIDLTRLTEIYRMKIYWETDLLDDTEDAVTYATGNWNIVFLNKNTHHTMCKIRWSIAHELGHVVLGHLQQCNLRSNRGLIYTLDREANIFAEELLMPADFIFSHYSHGFEYLKNACCVSEKSLEVRLMNLGLAGIYETAASSEEYPTAICLDDL